jgi:hypothetical protein
MGFSFPKTLAPEVLQRIRLKVRRTADEIARLHALPDRWLAEELLRLARGLRRDFPARLRDPHGVVYDANFVWQVVPEAAKRLGATRLLPNEAVSPSVVTLSGAEFRALVGAYLRNVSIGRWSEADGSDAPTAGETLCHCVANGNPVAFAADRICQAPEAGADRQDWVARHVREISRARGHEETPYWSPELQKPAARQATEAVFLRH